MSSKLVKQQLASVLHKQQKASEQQQPGGAGKGKGKQADSLSQRLKRVKRRRQAKAAPSEEQRQQEVLAANIKYYAKTVEAKGPAAELVAQVGSRRLRAAWPLPAAARKPACTTCHSMHRHQAMLPSPSSPPGAGQEGLPAAAARAAGAAAAHAAGGGGRGVG